MAHRFGGLLRGHLKDAEPELGDAISVVQVQQGDRCGLSCHTERLSGDEARKHVG
jgi:hypothetical protein